MESPTVTDTYIGRVNRVIDVVLEDLAGDLRLERLAAEAGFSPFHFHRVFKSVTGETLAEFVGRTRLERAIRMMTHGESTLTDIAAVCGFGTPSSFSRAFRTRYGVSPSAFDPPARLQPRTRPPRPGVESCMSFDLEVRPVAARTVVYRRVTNPYEPGRIATAIAELTDWVATTSSPPTFGWLGYSWDDPDIVDPADCRYDIAVEVAADTVVDGPLGVLTFGPTLVAEIDVSGAIDVEQQALDWLFGTWLPSSGYLPADQPTFEAWHGHPSDSNAHNLRLSIQLPLEPENDLTPKPTQ